MAGTLRMFRSLFLLSREIRRLFLFSIITVLIFEGIKLLPPLVFAEIIDRVISPEITFQLLLILLAGYLLSLVLMTLIEVWSHSIIYPRVMTSEVSVTNIIFKKLLSLDSSYHEKNNTGAHVNKIIKGSHRLAELLFTSIEQLIPVFFQIIFTFILLLFVSPLIALIFLCFIPLFVLLLIKNSRVTHQSREKYHHHYDIYAAKITQAISNVRTVKDFGNERREMRRTGASLNKYAHYLLERFKLGYRSMMWQDILLNSVRAGMLVISVWLMLNGAFGPGSLVLIMTLTEKAFLNLGRLHRAYYRIQDTEQSIERFQKILDEPIIITDGRHAHPVAKGTIAFDTVTFSYPGARGQALKSVSFEIPEKSVAAFVGRSGAGKSTLTKLLLRHYDVTAGVIRIDGVPIQDYNLQLLRSSIAIVSQDVELFNESIYYNIVYGNPRASRREVIRAAKLAHAHDFIKKLPNGYDTLVGEKGIKLSGGQKQRLAIARAILKKPKILIFDEATSSLDSESEKYIHEAIFSLIGKMTIVMIAHRFSTIEHAEQIFVFEKGKLAEFGTHAELEKHKGIFSTLRKLQKLGDVD